MQTLLHYLMLVIANQFVTVKFNFKNLSKIYLHVDQTTHKQPVTAAFPSVSLGCRTKIKCKVAWRVVWPRESHQRTHQWKPPFAWEGFGPLRWVIPSLFLQVVGSDLASSAIREVADMGQKVKQFHRCRGNGKTFTMALAITQTRLFSAGRAHTWSCEACSCRSEMRFFKMGKWRAGLFGSLRKCMTFVITAKNGTLHWLDKTDTNRVTALLLSHDPLTLFYTHSSWSPKASLDTAVFISWCECAEAV